MGLANVAPKCTPSISTEITRELRLRTDELILGRVKIPESFSNKMVTAWNACEDPETIDCGMKTELSWLRGMARLLLYDVLDAGRASTTWRFGSATIRTRIMTKGTAVHSRAQGSCSRTPKSDSRTNISPHVLTYRFLLVRGQ